MNKNNKLSYIKRYALYLLIALVLVTTVLASSVFAKYTTSKSQKMSITVEAYGEITLSLTEGQTSTEWSDASQSLYLVPGKTDIKFNPYVCVGANSEDCYLFVKVEEVGGAITVGEKSYTFADFVKYSIASGWTKGDGTNIPANVYYREVTKNTTDAQYFGIIKDDQVAVPDTVTAEMLNTFTDSTKPTITISAYAVQKTNLTDPDRDNTTAAGAWKWLQEQS